MNEPVRNPETGDWEVVTPDGFVYGFTNETDALQFANLQETFIAEELGEEIER